MSFEESMGAKVLAIWEAPRTSKKRVHGNLIVKGGDPLNAFMMDEEDLKIP